MKVLVTGSNGQLGYAVVKELQKQNIEHYGATRKDFDLIDFKVTEKFIVDYMPDVVIHCAAYTAVDRAEDEQGLCYLVNTSATENIADICKKINAKLLFVSTDYVFGDGDNKPWLADSKLCNPVNIYGKTKLEAEKTVENILNKYFIIRTSWLFGENGNNFVNTMLKLGKNSKCLRIVNDQIGRPTYAYDLAKLLVDMIKTEKYGYYNATNEGSYVSWYEFACEIFKQANYNVYVMQVTSEEYRLMALRPHNSKLDTSKLEKAGFKKLPDWQDALKRYLEIYKWNNQKDL